MKRARPEILLVMAGFFAAQIPGPLGAQSGRTFGPEEVCRELGAELYWDSFFQSGVLTVRDRRVAFYSGNSGESGPALVDGEELISVELPWITEAGSLRFNENFLNPVRRAFNRFTEEERTLFRIAAIIIDPGHGGKDSGAVGTHTINGKSLKSVEKDIALSVAKELYNLLSAACPGKKVLLTRSNDVYLTLEERVSTANSVPLRDNEAIIYISIHANASLKKEGRGYEIWYLPPETRRELIDREKYAGEYSEVLPILNDMLQAEFISESTRIGWFILNRFREVLGSSVPARGLKAENWYVVRNARMPSVLVELGFVTNPEDAVLMSDAAHLKKMSEALYKGIVDFVREFESSGGYIAP